jgi:DNA ligase-1
MRDFAALYARWMRPRARTPRSRRWPTTSRRGRPDADKLWTVALFSGRRPRRSITATVLRDWAAERAGLPLWLFEESHAVVGDLAETIALILPEPGQRTDLALAHWIARLAELSRLPDAERKAGILDAWDSLPGPERFLFTKLLTGSFRVGISQTLMTKALARATGQADSDVAHRLMGDWTPDRTTWGALVHEGSARDDQGRPYPFYLAYQLDDPADLGMSPTGSPK